MNEKVNDLGLWGRIHVRNDPRENEKMGCVQSAGDGDEAKSRKSHRRYSLFHVLVLLLTWFEFCAVREEGYISRTLYLPQVHIRVERHY